ncbi:hypothetical protein SRHO_G00011310 [Serrasalmus rhombeus]
MAAERRESFTAEASLSANITNYSNPFMSLITVNESQRPQMSYHEGQSRSDCGNAAVKCSYNPFIESAELFSPARVHAHRAQPELFLNDGVLPAHSPCTNPFLVGMETAADGAKENESITRRQSVQTPGRCRVVHSICERSRLLKMPHAHAVNPFTPTMHKCNAESTRIVCPDVPGQNSLSLLCACELCSVENQPVMQPDTHYCPKCQAHPPQACNSMQARDECTPHTSVCPTSCNKPPSYTQDDNSPNCSGDEYSSQRERVPVLRPGQFDGSSSWKEFLYRFESCAKANNWTENTKAIQLKFCLVGAAGAVIHKNPRSAQWGYREIVQQVEAAYGPASEHAAAVAIELRQRIRKPGEALHALRDDIYEKVSIVYSDRSETEQDSIAVEVFTNALADADIIQKLLENRPRTLAKAYEIAHGYETTRRAATSVTRLMATNSFKNFERKSKTAVVHESDTLREDGDQGSIMGVPAEWKHQDCRPSSPKGRFKGGKWKNNWAEIRCHNCSGIGHMKQDCPSPRKPAKPHPAQRVSNPHEHHNAPAVLTVKSGPEMCIHVLIHDREVCALLDSGARRNVLPLRYFNEIHSDVKPSLQPSTVQFLQGIGPMNITVQGEVHLPIQIGSRVASVNFLVADVARDTETILGHPFLEQSKARLDFGNQKIMLFGEHIPYFDPNRRPRTHIVRVARTATLESGCEYIVPGNAHFRGPEKGEVVLSPTKGFMEKHRVLVARVVVNAQSANHIPIRIYNPGASPVIIKKGAVAGVLQTAEVVQVQPTATTASRPGGSHMAVVPDHLQDLYAEGASVLSPEDKAKLAQLLQKYGDVFSTGPGDLGRTKLVQHDIQTLPGPPIKQPPRRMAWEKQINADQQIEQSLESGLAGQSHSSWASPIVMVRKKDQSYRLCVDYRALNERTVKDAYPLPRIQDTLDTLSTAHWFSTLDLAAGYWQVELTPRARQAAAFCSRKGLFTWNVMPFGLCNAPATFQRLMDRVLAGMQWETCLVYLDDIIILGRDASEMLERLGQVFERLRQANLKLKPAKCCLFRRQVAYLGHIVSERGISTDPQKILKVQDWPPPRNVSEVRQFVGLASYYRRFVKDFAAVAQPLHALTRKYARFQWTVECQEAFEELKNRLTSAPVLGYPLDTGNIILDTDASDFGIGAVLSQVQNDEERVLAYGSRRLSQTEQNYCTTRRELLAVVEFTSHFRQYLLGRTFTVRTDHSSLRWLMRMKEPEGQLARWLEKLGEYDFKVIHRPGTQHCNADAMSRRPCRKSCPCMVPDPSSSSERFSDQAVQCDLSSSEKRDCHASPAEFMPVGVDESSKTTLPQEVKNYSRGGERATSLMERVHYTGTREISPFQGWTPEQLCEAQKTDPDIAPVWRWLEEGNQRPTWKEVSSYNPATKAYWSQWDRLVFRENIIFRRFYSSENPAYHLQVLLPRVYRNAVVTQLHDGPVGGHFGVERTLTRLQTRYYWHQMKEDVVLWCRTCTNCAAKARPPKTPQAPMGTVRVGAPMERIAIDLMGPMNETERYNRYILVVQDYFTKTVEAYALPNDQAVTVADVLTAEWVCRYGTPHVLHSDQGSNFESEVFQRMCDLLGIEKTRTTPFRPQSDGQVERFNSTLQKILATTAERCHWDWDIMIPYAVMAYRATKHSSTGFTPNMMLFGREITEPIDIAAGDTVWHLIKGTKRVRNKVRKFLPSYEGPYFILGQLDDLVYRIQKSPKTKCKVVHHDKLKAYHSREPLDNSWVFKQIETWHLTEIPPPALDTEPDPDLSHLFINEQTELEPTELEPSNATEDTEQVPTETLTNSLNSPRSPMDTNAVHDSGGSTVPQDRKGTLAKHSTAHTPKGRPKRSRKAPKRYGEWTV